VRSPSARATVVALVIVVSFSSVLTACGSSSSSAPVTNSGIDYSKAANWLALPASITHKVDVFYLSDTAYSKPTPGSPNIGPINAPSMIKGDKADFQRTATAFSPVANIYAPYYRQVDALVQKSMTPANQIKTVAGIPTTDAIAAFEYYLKHYNDGRPFILAGHSQGSSVLTHLLAAYMKANPEVYKRMVAAYVIGYPITQAFLDQNPFLKFAKGPNDTGVIISFNTEAPTIGGVNPVMLSAQHALVINPITWTRTEAPATAQQNLGSWLPDSSTGKFVKVMAYANAQIDAAKGVLICSSADVAELAPGNPLLPEGVYHSYDYPFYYFNIRANAANRINHFLSR
jgi:pimeloyl-ACP methyl ester carboxylesterase